MKKILASISALLAIAACAEKFEEPAAPGGAGLSFTASMPGTRVSFGEKSGSTYPLVWNAGDCINVNGSVSSPLSAEKAGSAAAEFQTEAIEAPEYKAVSPAAAYSDGTVTIPKQQACDGTTADPSAIILAGTSTTTDIALNHSCAFVKVTLTKAASETLRSVSILSLDDTPMSGRFSVDFSSGALTPAGDNLTLVHAGAEEGVPYTDGKVSFIFSVPAGSYPKGFALTASSTDGGQMARKAYGTGVTLSAGTLVAMPELAFADDGITFSGGSGTQADPYLIRTAEDVRTLSEMSNSDGYAGIASAYFQQAADIDMSGTSSLSPICNTESTPFNGHYDGKGFTISGVSNAGLFGFCGTCTISDLKVSGDVRGSSASTGILVRKAIGGTYTGIHTSGKASGTGYVGGIFGFVNNATDVLISGCSSTAEINASSNYAGGIIGAITAKAPVLVDKCSSYSTVKGLYSVGGISGLSYISDTAPATSKIAHTNCVYSGRLIEATGNNGANGYAMAGGIVGWMRINQTSAAEQHILNCVSYVQKMSYVSTYGGNPTTYPCVAGIVGLQDKSLNTSSIQGCYSDFKLCRLWCDGANKSKTINNNDNESLMYGAIYGKSSTAMPYKHCYYDNSTKMGPGFTSLTQKSDVGEPGNYSSLVTKLNGWVSSYSGPYTLLNWEKDARGCVVPAGMSSDSGCGMPKRISVIGDSISTFRSWIPIGYAVYYYDNRVVDGKTTDVTWDKTYWGNLTTKWMKDAIIEKNLSWSGSCTSTCDDQTSKPGFTTRMAKSGVGAPDIVLIHGGTNDWNRNYNNSAVVDNTAGFKYNEEVTDAAMDILFNTDVNALNDRNFLDAYVKLVKQIHAEQPQAKIVCVIGDRPDLAMIHGIIKIANHYDFCRYVDFRSAGYNTLPKFSGSHPTAAGHATMAATIYAQLGEWLEQ